MNSCCAITPATFHPDCVFYCGIGRGYTKVTEGRMKAKEVFSSYRNLVLRNFSPYPCKCGGDWLNQFRHRVSESLVNIDKEQELLSLNLVSLGEDMIEFQKQLVEYTDQNAGTLSILGRQVTASWVLALLDVVESLEVTRDVHYNHLDQAFLSGANGP